MQITISTRHGQLQDENRRLIHEKAQKLLHYFDRLAMIAVTVDLKDELLHQVEVLVSAEHKHDFVGREAHPDVLVATDLALDNVKQQLRRYKEKIQDHRRDPAAREVAGDSNLP